MTQPLLSTAEAVQYWDDRHRRHDDLRSGGHIGTDHASNEWFYATRLGSLLAVVGDRTSTQFPLFALDAGCGKGYFARGLGACGHRVDGIDTSSTAIEHCRASGPGRYTVSTLAGWSVPWVYDVVYSVDVLFHVLDEDEWAASVRNLGSLVRLGGRLVLGDEFQDQGRRLGNYIVHRPRQRYLDLLEPAGFELREFRPYGYRENRIGLAVLQRVA